MNFQGYLFEDSNPKFSDDVKYVVLTLVGEHKRKILNLIKSYNSGPLASRYSFAVWGSPKDMLYVKLIIKGSLIEKTKSPELLDENMQWLGLEYIVRVRIQKYQFMADKGPSKGQKVRGIHLFLESISLIAPSFAKNII